MQARVCVCVCVCVCVHAGAAASACGAARRLQSLFFSFSGWYRMAPKGGALPGYQACPPSIHPSLIL